MSKQIWGIWKKSKYWCKALKCVEKRPNGYNIHISSMIIVVNTFKDLYIRLKQVFVLFK